MLTTKIQNYLSPRIEVRLLGFILSLFLSLLWCGYNQPINVDGMLYLQAASVFKNEGLKACLAVYSWPFYSILIAITSCITGLSLLTAGHVITSLLIGLMVVSFILVVEDLGGDKITQFIACFVILTFPAIAHERYDIFRDFGYYAFGLLSLHYLLRYQQTSKFKHALLWGASILIATLFRIEGMVIQLVMPFLFFFASQISFNKRLLHVIQAHIINIILLVGLLFLFVIKGIPQNLGRLNDFFSTTSLDKLTENFSQYVDILRVNLNVFIAQDIKAIIIGGMIAILFKNLFMSLTPIHAFLSFYGFNLVPWKKDQKLIYYGMILLNLIILAFFVWIKFFLVLRYTIFLALLILLCVPFTLKAVWQRWQRNKSVISENIRLGLIACALIILSASSIFLLGANKSYIIQAGDWIKNNTPENARLYTTEIKLIYYSNRPGSRYPDDFPYGVGVNLFSLRKMDIQQYDYAAISVAKKHIPDALQIFSDMKLSIVKKFVNNRHDVIFILKTPRKSESA